MPAVPFDRLPPEARVWVFAASDPLRGESATRLLNAVDTWLGEWKAHDEPLTCARDWREDRFLAIGVDQTAAGASGCSVDALFRIFQPLQAALGTSLLAGGRVFWRDPAGEVRMLGREVFASGLARGSFGEDTPVFDTTLVTAHAWRTGFERPLRDSWHRALAGAR